ARRAARQEAPRPQDPRVRLSLREHPGLGRLGADRRDNGSLVPVAALGHARLGRRPRLQRVGRLLPASHHRGRHPPGDGAAAQRAGALGEARRARPAGPSISAGQVAGIRRKARLMVRERYARLCLPLAALLAVGLSPPAAAATWSEPVPLLNESVFLWSRTGAQMVYGGGGRARAGWPAAVDPMTVHTLTAVRDAGGGWRAGTALPAGVIPDFVAYARTRLIGLEYRETTAGTSNGLYVRFGVLGGPLGTPRRLSRGAYSDTTLAANPRGAAVVVAATGRSGATRIRASYRPAGRSFPVLRTVSAAWARFPAAA